MNILIIGGNGFIGSHLLEVLSLNHKVVIFDRSPNQFVSEYPNVEYVYGDFHDSSLLKTCLENIDIVYHLLSTTVPLTANLDPIVDVESNVVGTIKLLEMVSKSNVKRFIYTSSGGTVYGNPEFLPIDERHPCNPIGSYGIVKNTIEHYVKMFASKKNFSYLIVRPSNPYGPRQNYNGNQGLISKLLYNGMIKEEFTIWGDGSAVRDYIYIDDLVNFLKIAGLTNKSGVYNVGSGKGKSINEIIRLLSTIVDELPPIKYVKKNGFFVEKVVLDINSAVNTFKWNPEISLEQGLKYHQKWMQSAIAV